jgi:hypothetical protein
LEQPGWNGFAFGVAVPSRFIVTLTVRNSYGLPSYYATDHPALGPTGLPGCGTCYPTARIPRSFYYGSTLSPLCPGEPLDDGMCSAELIWEAHLSCDVQVKDSSWGQIKALYR